MPWQRDPWLTEQDNERWRKIWEFHDALVRTVDRQAEAIVRLEAEVKDLKERLNHPVFTLD